MHAVWLTALLNASLQILQQLHKPFATTAQTNRSIILPTLRLPEIIGAPIQGLYSTSSKSTAKVALHNININGTAGRKIFKSLVELLTWTPNSSLPTRT